MIKFEILSVESQSAKLDLFSRSEEWQSLTPLTGTELMYDFMHAADAIQWLQRPRESTVLANWYLSYRSTLRYVRDSNLLNILCVLCRRLILLINLWVPWVMWSQLWLWSKLTFPTATTNWHSSCRTHWEAMPKRSCSSTSLLPTATWTRPLLHLCKTQT